MKINLLNRVFYTGLVLLVLCFYVPGWEDARDFSRGLAYTFLIFGISRLFLNFQFGFWLKGNFPIAGRIFSVEEWVGVWTWMERILYWVLVFLLFFGFAYHFIHITLIFRDGFFLGEKDFTSMGEVILNFSRGNGFHSPFHGDGNSSYLSHHFSPGIILYAPFFNLFSDRLALAWGQLFFSLLLFVGVYLYAVKEWNLYGETKSIHPKLWILLFMILAFFNIYIYRMALSYHFEILFVLCFLFLIYIRNFYIRREISTKRMQFAILEILLVLGILSVKEDTAIYLFLYYFGEGLYHSIKEKNPLGGIREFFFSGFFIIYFLLLLPWIREFLGVTADENWLAIWKFPQDNPKNSSLPGIVDIVFYFLQSPQTIIQAWISHRNILWEIGLGFGFLFFLSPRYFFYVIGIFTIHFLSGREWHNTFYNYYIYPLLPILIVASLEGFRKLVNISYPRTGLALSFLVFFMVFYRNSWDKNFPFSKDSIPNSKNSTTDVHYAHILKNQLISTNTVSSQFDLGIWVPIETKLYPIQENPTLPNGILPERIIINTISGFSPYIPLSRIQEWRANWIANYNYKSIEMIGDFEVLGLVDE